MGFFDHIAGLAKSVLPALGGSLLNGLVGEAFKGLSGLGSKLWDVVGGVGKGLFEKSGIGSLFSEAGKAITDLWGKAPGLSGLTEMATEGMKAIGNAGKSALEYVGLAKENLVTAVTGGHAEAIVMAGSVSGAGADGLGIDEYKREKHGIENEARPGKTEIA